MTDEPTMDHDNLNVAWWKPVLFAALAGGMAWGIRGQYGHETGAMIAGLLVSLVLTHLLCPKVPITLIVRAAALGTVAMGIGGSMTYGQTVGLTHNANVVGNGAAWYWGMLGLALKGGTWIGFCGVFLGLGLSGIHYRTREMFALMFAALGVFYMGTQSLNFPYYPEAKVLPYFYFSGSWHWEPDTIDLKPRLEVWGGLILALAAITVYVSIWRKDALARNMAFWGFLGGAIGFPTGQAIQSYNAWHPGFFEEKLLGSVAGYMNWWNIMETTFGVIMGACLGLGLWLNRRKIAAALNKDSYADTLPIPMELFLIALHITLLVCVEFYAIPNIDALYDLGLIMAIIPIAVIVGSRFMPYLILFPIVLIPIAGKTLKQLAFDTESISLVYGWVFYFGIPLIIALLAAGYFYFRHVHREIDNTFARKALFITAWTYFLLNWAFFGYPWPWAEWTGRTTNGILFTVAIFGLTFLTLFMPNSPKELAEEAPHQDAGDKEWPDHSTNDDMG